MVRIVLAVLCLSVVGPAFAEGAGDDYPNRSVRVVVPFAAGGPTDTYARVVAEKLQSKFGQPFVVENKPGATGIVGTSFVATSTPDGYTLLFASNSSQVVGPLLQTRKVFDAKDFRPLSMLLYYPMYLVVGAQVPAKTVKEFVQLAKEQPDKMNYGSPGTGSGGHLTSEIFKNAADIHAVHVPYKGVGPAQIGLMSGEIQFIFDSVGNSQQLVDDGKLRGLAVTGRERLPRVPDIPTLKESGYNGLEDVVIWLGMLAPTSTPEPVARKLEAALIDIAKLPDVVKRIQEGSSVLAGGSGKDFSDFIARETPAWDAIIKKNKILVNN